MFTEVLRIKPKLDPGDSARMDSDLNRRFSNVARRFGQGLKAVIKGSFIGISLGLISRLLNPLQELEEKIKDLLGQGTDLQDQADKFGTTPGQLRRLQDVSSSLGVTPDQLKDLMNKFASAVEDATLELKDNPTQPLTGKNAVVKDFIGTKDLAEGFFTFIQNLKKVGEGPGKQIPTGIGTFRQQTGLETQQATERELFGEVQHGATRRLINGDLAAQLQKIGEPSAASLNKSAGNLIDRAAQQRILETIRLTKDFQQASAAIKPGTIALAEKNKTAEDSALTTKIGTDAQALLKAEQGVQEIKILLETISSQVTQGLGQLGEFVGQFRKLGSTRAFRGIFESVFGKPPQ